MSIVWKKESSNGPLPAVDFQSSKVYVLVRKNLQITERTVMEDFKELEYTYDSAFMTPMQYMEYASSYPKELITSDNENGQFINHPDGEVIMNHVLETDQLSGFWVYPCAISEVTKIDVTSTTGETIKIKAEPLGLVWTAEAAVSGKILFNVTGAK